VGCYVQPYADDPLDDERVGYEVYMNILREARDYVYFSTPYLVISDDMKEEIISAAKRGIDVRIVIPGIPDKKCVYHVGMDFAEELAENNVKVYRYSPGFNHAKICVSDDLVAVVSTVNLDYRSLYHHYECGVVIYDDRSVMAVCTDLREMFNDSQMMVNEKAGKDTLLKKLFDLLLRMFAPLL
jgi:cardiolipin synthase